MTSEIENSESISIGAIFQILKRHALSIILFVMVFAALGVLAAEYLPKKYKSKAILSIQSGYFQHPLVRDLISEVQDPGELSAQRLALLRMALNDTFLDRLGEKYGYYQYPWNSRMRLLDREEFLKKIEYFAVSPSSFQISIISDDPNTAFDVTSEVLNQMTFTLIDQRYQTLMQAREAILKQAKLLNNTLGSEGGLPNREALETELAKMEAGLAALRTRYTDSHPEVVRMRGRSRALAEQIRRTPRASGSPQVDDYTKVFLSPASRASSQEIFNDLLRKLSHLNVVLEMERDRQNVSYLNVIEQPTVPTKPFFPDPIEFALYGGLLGLIVSGIRMTYSEIKRSARLSPERAALEFDFDILGELPPFETHHARLFLGGPRRVAALPHIPPEN